MNVGDTGFIVYTGRDVETAPKYPGTVVKVCRKWATVQCVDSWRTEKVLIKNGAIDGKGYSSPGSWYTPEEWEMRARVKAANVSIRAHGLTVGYMAGADWCSKRRLALAAWLEANPDG